MCLVALCSPLTLSIFPLNGGKSGNVLHHLAMKKATYHYMVISIKNYASRRLILIIYYFWKGMCDVGNLGYVTLICIPGICITHILCSLLFNTSNMTKVFPTHLVPKEGGGVLWTQPQKTTYFTSGLFG